MKKISLVLGFALMASVLFAQNTAVTNQTGTNNKSGISQTNSLNSASTDQIGADNQIKVEQKGGNSNIAVGVQNGVRNGNASVPANYGYIKQDGASNQAYLYEGKLATQAAAEVKSNDADAFIDQKGNGNIATISTKGDGFNSPNHGITQIQVANIGLLGNRATVIQQTVNGVNLDMNIYQSGSDNEVNGTQIGNNSQYAVRQVGLSNNATVNQTGGGNQEAAWYNFGPEPTWNVLSQTGARNIASASQAGNSLFKMTQIGDDNTAKIDEQGNNVVSTLQNGNLNIIGGILNCVPTDVAVFVNGASMDATQLGDKNKLYVSTAGSLTVVQNNVAAGASALGNTIKYTQTAAGVVGLTQTGDNNLIWLKNTSATVPMSVDVDQLGNGNTVASFENGIATGCAKFAGSHLDVDQIGDLNSLHLNSTGALDVVDVMQNGTSNWASVTQSAF